jgi:hypothetical protein
MLAKSVSRARVGRSDIAVSSWEAACLLGVHWTRPAVMAREGLLTSRALRSASDDENSSRTYAIYSGRECDENYEEYEQLMAGPIRRRPRAHVDDRPQILRQLERLKHKIEFGDAVGAVEAAEIMGVHWSWPPRMARRGVIIGRIMHNGRATSGSDRLWIFSRASCVANLAAAKRMAASGNKFGRPRSGF